MPKILITGATGFVGSHVLETLITINHPDIEVVAACRQPQQLLPAFKGEVRVGDLRDMAYQDRLLAGIDIVCHTAGWSSFLNQESALKHYYLEPSLELINRVFEWRIKRLVNLSSLAVTGFAPPRDEDTAGTPRRGCPMLNCLIAVENYLKAQSAHYPTRIINLRLGIYSGKRMRRGLLRTVLAAHPGGMLPYASGSRGYLPLVDGRDIGQAFSRAALAPAEAGYVSMDITGPEVPRLKDVLSFIQSHGGLPHTHLLALPDPVYRLITQALGFWPGSRLAGLTPCQLGMLGGCKPEGNRARQRLGYDPAISWQASLLDMLAHPLADTGPLLHDPTPSQDD